MQLLGLFTSLLPVYRKTAQHAFLWPKTWTLALTAVGFMCTVSAIPLYLLAPIFWGRFVSFIGTACQACLALQLALFADGLWAPSWKDD